MRVHFVGIGGSGMAGLAAFLLRRGARVSGTDRQASSVTEQLTTAGARIAYLQEAAALPADAELVVASAAVPAEHAELREARRRGLAVLKYAELLGQLLSQRRGIAVSGTHGKSTTTAWLAHVLQQAGLGPSFVVGATAEQLGGGSGAGDGPHFIVEACEYDRSFLNLRPHAAAILNIEEDHLDCYADLAAIGAAFEQFAAQVAPDGLLVINADSAPCARVAAQARARVESFSLLRPAEWNARDTALEGGTYAFDLAHGGTARGRVRLALAGRHNVANALAVAALAREAGVDWPSICAGLSSFRGVSRRLETCGEARGVRVVDDYAHHPTELRVTLAAARERFAPKRLWCVFQPHQHSRTRFLLEDFARSFADADFVLVPRIYFVRDSEREREAICAEDLVARIRDAGGNAEFLPEPERIVAHLVAQVRPGDLVITMGAGDIWKVAHELVDRLGADLPD